MNTLFQAPYDCFIKEGFLPLDSSSYPLFRKYNQCSRLQEKNGVMLVTWKHAFFGLYKIINECVCSVFFHEGRDIYWTIHRLRENADYPLQPIIDTLCGLCKKAELPVLLVKFVDEDLLADYKAVQGHAIETMYNVDNSEYVYKTKDVLKLSGPANYSRRRRLKKFLERQDISFRPITNSSVHLCVTVEDEWCLRRDCAACRSFFGCEKEALKAMTTIFDEAFHCGVFMYINEKLYGYLIGEIINENLSLLYYGKAVIEDGLVYLIYIMLRDYLKHIEYINVDEDMGHEGLRKFKQQFCAYELWHKYMVTYSL